MTCIVTGHGKWRDKTAVSMTSRLCIYISIFAIKDTTCYLNDSRPATDDSLWEIRPSAYTDLYGWGKLLWPVSHSKHVYCNKNTRQRCTRFETIWTWTIYTSVWTVSQHKNTRYSTNSFIYISYFNMDFKPFCLNLFISFWLDFDLAVNVLCLEILWNLLGRHCECTGLSFRSIVCPRLLLCSRLVEDRNQYKSSNLFWVRCSIGRAQEHPIHHWGRRHTYTTADGNNCAQRVLWKRVKFRIVTYFGHRTGKQWRQPNQNGKRLCPMGVGCPRSEHNDALGILKSPMELEDIPVNPSDTG